MPSSNPDSEIPIRTQYCLHPSAHLSTTSTLGTQSEDTETQYLQEATCQTWLLLPQVLLLSQVSPSYSPLTTPHPHTATVLIERGHEFGSNLQNTGADAVNSVSLLPPPKNTVRSPGDSPQSLSLTNKNLQGCECSSTMGNMLSRHKSWVPALALFLFFLKAIIIINTGARKMAQQLR